MVLVLFIAACGRLPLTPTNTSYLAGSTWTLILLEGEDLIEGARITLEFKEENLSGSTGCNGYGGGFDGGKYADTNEHSLMVIPPFTVTVQLCSEPEGIMEQEATYIEALMNAASFRVLENRLEINNGLGETSLVFIENH